MGDLLGAIRRFLTPDGALDARDGSFMALCRVGAVLAIGVVVPVNLAEGLPLAISAWSAAFGGYCLWLHREARLGRVRRGGLLLALLLVLNAAWFPNAGAHGSIPLFYFPALLFALIYFTGRTRWVYASLITVNFWALIAISWAWPDLATPFESETARLVDLWTGLIVAGLAAMLMVTIVLSWYDRERHRLQVTVQALASSEAQLAKLFQLNPDSVTILDPETRTLIDANAGFERVTGWPRAEAIGRTSVDWNFWVTLSERDALFSRLDRDGSVSGFTLQFRRRDGELRWGSISVEPIEYGGRPALLSSLRDITEQRLADRAVAESQAIMESLVNSAAEMVWLADPKTHVLTLYNKAFADYFMRDHGKRVALGKGPDDVLPPAVAAQWHQMYERAVAEGPHTVEYTTTSGRYVLLLSFDLAKHEGRVVGVSVFGKDITERRRADERRAKLELDLLQAQKMESLGSLAGGVAHDFNNMLDGIMGYAELMLLEETDPVRLGRLQAILSAAARSSELTRKLLAFARRGKNIVEASHLGALVSDTLVMLRPSLRQGTTVQLALEETSTVDGDPSQLSQMIINLCINAAEAMPQGGVLRVSTADRVLGAAEAAERGVAAGPVVEFTVSDTGVGMTDEVKRRIFEPFFTTKRDGQLAGTGLGLATVYGVVQLHRGAVDVRSAPGRGTTFTVWLPKGTLPPAEPAAAGRVAPGHGIVLIVEDEELLRSLHAEMVEKLGYQAIVAADGVEAVEVFRQRHRDLAAVLLDLKMPRKGGREAYMEMRAVNAEVPVLICSGFGDNEEAQGMISQGARGLLAKPFRLADLAGHLDSLRASRV